MGMGGRGGGRAPEHYARALRCNTAGQFKFASYTGLLQSGKVPVNAAAETPEERKTRLQQVRDRPAASHELPSPQDVDPIDAHLA